MGAVDIGKSVILPRNGDTTLVQIGLVSGTDPMAVVKSLHSLPFVAWASPNYIYRSESLGPTAEYVPNDTFYAAQQHHGVVHNDWSWDVTEGASRIVVAITDDGFDLAHVDLHENVWVNQAEIPTSRKANLTDLNGDGILTMHELNDPVNQGPYKITDQNGNGRIDALDLLAPMNVDGGGNDSGSGGWANGWDDNDDLYVDDLTGWDHSSGDNNASSVGSSGHGTHVAGIVAARTNNGIGTAGGAGNVTFMPVRFYGSGSWTSSQIYSAYAYAADHGARIVSTSYNIDGYVSDPTFAAALDYLYDKGVLHFNSAGNNNQADPARGQFDQSLYVVSTNIQDRKSSFSNYGSALDIAAPGEGIYSTLPGNSYGSMSGTSMATPVVAAAAALIWSAHPDWTRDQVAAQLLASTDNIDAANPNYIGQLGAGRVNTYRALLQPAGNPVLGSITGLPSDGGTTSSRIRGFEVEVDSVLDSSTVMNSASWELRRVGRDGVFGTPDDVIVPVQLQTQYQIGTNQLSFQLASTLGPGRYQFRALSGGLADPFGQPLDGNGDGAGGDDFIREFTVVIAGRIIVRPVLTTNSVSSFGAAPVPDSRRIGTSHADVVTGAWADGETTIRTRQLSRPRSPLTLEDSLFVGSEIVCVR